MNNLKYLRKKANISLRKLEEYTGITFTTLGKIENNQRSLRLSHINALCDFFKVSSDFLLGKSDTGIIVELKKSFAIINKNDYEKYLENGWLTEYVEYNSVWRLPNNYLGNLLDPENNASIKNEILSEIDMLSEEQLKKVLKFIKEILV